MLWSGSAIIYEFDTSGRVDVGAVLGTAQTAGDLAALIAALNDLSSAQAESACDAALATYDGPTKTELDSAETAIIAEVDANETKIDALNDITAAAVVTALMADTGFTAGGTLTFEKLLKVLAATLAGHVRDKSGEAGTYEVLDADDDSTVIYEFTLSESTPYKIGTIS